jgi:PPK2 family polyphosphate:nucleotide phosphotransferase
MSKLTKMLLAEPGRKLHLNKIDPNGTCGVTNKEKANAQLEKNLERLALLQYLLYAEGRRALLIVLQGIDAGGKDGTIRRVMTGFNPQGVSVTSFKAPAGEEKRHDYLWRVHKAVPGFGEIGIFNRSHYEEVLIVRVRNLVHKNVWSKRYDQINAFEEMLYESGVHVVKFFLYIDRDEQKKRFQERLEDPTKNWKFSPQDLEERKYWDEYMTAFEDAISKCSKAHAPWYVIPANKKWFRNLAVSEILVDTFEAMKLQYPKPVADLSKIQFE